MFTQQTLRRRATDKVFDRGQALWASGAVTKLSRSAPTRFSARVRGTHSYHVAAWAATGEVEFSCDCAYEFEGLCKHAVALGLAILDSFGASLADPDQPAGPVAAAVADTTPGPLSATVAAAWAARPAAEKLRFLELALTKSDDLARQFLSYGGPASAGPTNQVAAPADPLASLAEELTETLSALEFGDDFWESNPRYAYDDEGESMLEDAYDAVRAALAPFGAALLRLARGGQLTGALRYWATASAAIYAVKEPASDEYGLFGSYGEDALHLWHETLTAAGWPAGLTSAVLAPAEVKAALKWLKKHLITPSTRWPSFEADWLPLLLALADDPAIAAPLPAALIQAGFGPETQARLRLRRAQTQADDPAWVAAATELLPHDAAVAQQLLNYYLSQAARPTLLRTATAAHATWPDRFGDFVLRTFPPAEAPGLYRDALRYRALANYSLADFELLRPLLDAAGRLGFVQAAVTKARGGRGVAFAAGLLAREGVGNELRDFVLGLEWLAVSPPGEVKVALTLLAKADPTPLMLELETRLPAYLRGRAGARRGHLLYERIARWLAAALAAAPRLREPVLRLAQALRAEFPTLHGLKDALRGEDLLPGEGVGRADRRGGR